FRSGSRIPTISSLTSNRPWRPSDHRKASGEHRFPGERLVSRLGIDRAGGHSPAAFPHTDALAPDEAERSKLERRPEDPALSLDHEPLFAKRPHARKADSLPFRDGLVSVVISREAPQRVFLPTIQNHGVPLRSSAAAAIPHCCDATRLH